MCRLVRATAAALMLVASGCAAAGEGDAWSGTTDTLPSGQIVVANPAAPLWPEGGGWRIADELRIGTVDGDGPDLFGRIIMLDVDAEGRVYVLEGQAQEIRVFDRSGGYVRTIGRQGGGPGEFNQPVHMQFGPDGNLWVVDPQNNRVSVFDTAGTYLAGHPMPGGFIIIPWPGGFDLRGHYYSPIPRPSEAGFQMGMAHFDESMTAIDTLEVPDDPVERPHFEMRRGDAAWMASVPYTAGFDWLLSPAGTFWGMFTGDYRLFELSQEGDTLRTITRAFERLPVTDADMEAARERLSWFIEQGGKVDWGKIPSEKPATSDFFVDEDGYVWVTPVTAADDGGHPLDVFDPDGRYLGRVALPGRLVGRPLVRGDRMYAVTRNELEVPFVARWRIEKP